MNKRYLSAVITIFIVASLLLIRCQSKKEASAGPESSSGAQEVRFDSLRSIIVKNKKLITASLRLHVASASQRREAMEDIDRIANNDFTTVTSGMPHSSVDDYLRELSDITDQIFAPYLLRGLDPSVDTVTLDHVGELLYFQVALDSLLALEGKEDALSERLKMMEQLLHKTDSIRSMDTTLQRVFDLSD